MPDAYLAPGENFMLSGGVGGYAGHTALGFTGAVRINKQSSLNAGVGVATGGKKHIGWKANGRIGW